MTLHTFAGIVGVVCLVLITVTALCFGIAAAAWHIGLLREKRDALVRQLHAREIGRTLWSSGWWFDNPDTKRAIQLIGISMQMHGTYDVDKVREQWRLPDEQTDVSTL